MSRKFFVTWHEFHRDVQALAWNLPPKSWKGIVAVTRGGLVPAALLARSLNIKLIETVSISSYDDVLDRQAEPDIIKNLPEEDDGEGWLVVDDLVDTGETLKIVRGMFPKAHYATVYAKAQGKKNVDSYVAEVNAWIVFPWEEEAPERLFSLS